MFIVLTKYTHIDIYTHTLSPCVQTVYDGFIVARRACDALETQFAPYRPLASSSSSSQILPGFPLQRGLRICGQLLLLLLHRRNGLHLLQPQPEQRERERAEGTHDSFVYC